MRVLLLSRYGRLGSTSRVRYYQLLPRLVAQGIEVECAPLLPDDYLVRLYTGERRNLRELAGSYVRRLGSLLGSRRFDLVWVEKEILPWLPAWGEGVLRAFGIPYVADYDDAWFHRYDLHSNRWIRRALGGKIDAVMQRAAAVTVGNEYLADRARRAGAQRIELIPTVVDLARYSRVTEREQEPFTIGWIGTPLTAPYLRLVQEALAEVCRGGAARLVLVGSGPIQLDGVAAEVRPWSERSEVVELQGFDVGIMPLPDRPWERGKCGYKLIQYMACGLPVIASPVGVNFRIVEHGVSGFLASRNNEWIDALGALRGDPALAARMGNAGRARVESCYGIEAVVPRLAALFREVVGGTGPARATA